MMKRAFGLLGIVSLVGSQQIMTCHYSCTTCVGESYNMCVDCQNDIELTVVQDPATCEQQYLNSNVPSGVCLGVAPEGVNGLGVVILLVCIGLGIITRTKQSFYLLSTLQTLALLSFVEIGWVSPANYLLQSMQYLMVFNLMARNSKTQDYTMLQRQHYRVDNYYKNSALPLNFTPIAVIDFLLFIGIVVLAIIQYRARKQSQKQEIEIAERKSQKSIPQLTEEEQWENKPLSQKICCVLLKVFLTTFYFLIQQTNLTILVALRFQQPKIAAIICGVLYALVMLFYMCYLSFNHLWFFPNSETQFVNIWRKLIVPVFVIVPIELTFLIIPLLFLFIFIESSYDYRGGHFALFSRITLYKILQFLVILLCLAYFLTDRYQNNSSQTRVISIFVSIGILAFFACFILEAIIGTLETFFGKNQISNIPQNSNNRAFNQNVDQTEQNIDPNIFNTKNDIQIYDIEDQEQQARKRQEEERRRKEEQENQRKRKQQEERRRKQEQQRRRKRQEQQRKRREEQQRRRREQELLRKKLNDQKRRKQQEERKKLEQEKKRLEEQRKRKAEQERLRKQEEQRKRLEDQKRRLEQQRLRKEEEQRERIEEQKRRKLQEEIQRLQEEKKRQAQQERLRKQEEQRKRLQEKRRKQEEERQRKEEQERQRLKKLAEEAEKKRLEEQAKRRKRQEQIERIRKQQEEEEERMRKKKQEAEERRRKKRQFKGEEDQQLRKRYGM